MSGGSCLEAAVDSGHKGRKTGELELADKKWLVSEAGSLEDMWDRMTDEDQNDEDHIPYWAEIWPASDVLAAHIQSRAALLSGRLCLEVGCGQGLTSLVAGSLGARTIAMDFERSALVFARKNARLNNVSWICWVQMDWRRPGFRPAGFDYIWAADVLYEKRFFPPLADLFRHSIKDGGRIWIADQKRNVSDAAWDYFENRGFKLNELKTDRVTRNGQSAIIRLVELMKQG